MSYACIVTISQDSRVGESERNQVSRPVYSGMGAFLTRLRERIEFSDFRRWLG
jgi:hypothetical protein